MKIQVVIEFDEAVRLFAAWCPELPGCASAGDTKDEALANVRQAIRLYFDFGQREWDGPGRVHEIEFR